MGVWFPQLTKGDLLELLEACPQRFWPPRPSRQDVATLREAVRRASIDGYCGATVRAAVGARLVERRAHQR